MVLFQWTGACAETGVVVFSKTATPLSSIAFDVAGSFKVTVCDLDPSNAPYGVMLDGEEVSAVVGTSSSGGIFIWFQTTSPGGVVVSAVSCPVLPVDFVNVAHL